MIPKNSEDPDGMPQDAAFHQGLHCLQYNPQGLNLAKYLTVSISDRCLLPYFHNYLDMSTCEPC